jgi:hypothetical protein
MKIEGIPEGWECVRIGTPFQGEWFLEAGGEPVEVKLNGWIGKNFLNGWIGKNFVILRKVEKPKTYRPFANAEEFKPHRDRWWKWNPVKFLPNRNCPPLVYDDNGHGAETWEQNFRDKVFDDGSPFGVEVSE